MLRFIAERRPSLGAIILLYHRHIPFLQVFDNCSEGSNRVHHSDATLHRDVYLLVIQLDLEKLEHGSWRASKVAEAKHNLTILPPLAPIWRMGAAAWKTCTSGHIASSNH